MKKNRHAHNVLPNSLGELELTLLDVVWKMPDSDARTITAELSDERTVSLSTVQSTLERLVRKNLLERKKLSHAYRYRASQSRSELLGNLLKDVIKLLHDGKAATILSSFVNVADRLDDNALDELEQLIQHKRKETGGNRE